MKRFHTAFTLTAAGLLSVALGACDSLTSDEAPIRARVVAEVDTDVPLEFVISSDFDVVLDPLTGNVDPAFNEVDSLTITEDYETTVTFDPTDPKLFVHLGNVMDGVSPVRLRVFLDGQVEYDAQANLGNGGFLEYLYRYNQPEFGR